MKPLSVRPVAISLFPAPTVPAGAPILVSHGRRVPLDTDPRVPYNG